MAQDQIARHLEQHKGNEEDKKCNVELIPMKMQFFLDAQHFGVANIDPIREGLAVNFKSESTSGMNTHRSIKATRKRTKSIGIRRRSILRMSFFWAAWLSSGNELSSFPLMLSSSRVSSISVLTSMVLDCCIRMNGPRLEERRRREEEQQSWVRLKCEQQWC